MKKTAKSKTFWLSFIDTDSDRPVGQRFLGVAIVLVTDAEAETARRLMPPQALPGAEWIAAAARKAWALGCNPGGEIGAMELPTPPDAQWMNRLLSKEEAEAIEMAHDEQA